MHDDGPFCRFRPLRLRSLAALGLAALLAFARPGMTGEEVRFEARAGLDPAEAAARVWAPDAFLVYLENDEALSEGGVAARWGYLYFSPTLQKSRAYSIREGRILVAENLEMQLEAPPVAAGWIDSGSALRAAEQAVGIQFRREHDGRLGTMLLMRGAFQDREPDETTWTIVYTSPRAPSLFVVVDAAEARVRRIWRG